MSANLQNDFEAILEHIIEGETFENIANMFYVSRQTLFNFLNKQDHSARVREAIVLSAASFQDKATQAILELKSQSTLADITKARELAQHYRWCASKRNPVMYGDRPGKDLPPPPNNIEDLKLLAAAINQ